MALVALNKSVQFRYVSDRDPSKSSKETPIDPKDLSKGMVTEEVIDSGATVFILQPLDVFLMGKVFDQNMRFKQNGEAEVGIEMAINQTNIEAVKYGLVGWEGLKGADGSDIPFTSTNVILGGRKYTVASDKSLNCLDVELFGELGAKVKEKSRVTVSQAKN